MNPLMITGLFQAAQELINRLWPDPEKKAEAQAKLLEMQQKGELAELAAATDLAKGQLAINQEEAKSESTFVAGWRPFVGWIGGLGLAYAAIIEPLLRFVSAVGYGYTGEFPVIDTALTMQVLFGILGLGMMRSYDKLKGNGMEVGKH